jgi:hypothetical protein
MITTKDDSNQITAVTSQVIHQNLLKQIEQAQIEDE